MRKILILAGIIAAVGCKQRSQSTSSDLHSDHIDGDATKAHSITDLTDLFVFPAPDKPNQMTVVLNVHPLSRDHNHFSDKVNYNFYFRKASLDLTTKTIITDAASEQVIVCKFATPGDHSNHSMNCSNSLLGQTNVLFNKATKTPGPLQTYHGLRNDPFFFDSKFATSLVADGVLKPRKGENTMAQTNILAMVLEFDPKALLGNDVSLIAVATQSYTTTSNSPFTQLDRLGRPEVTNVTMAAHGSQTDLRDMYNNDRPFKVAPALADKYRTRIIENLAHYDKIDGTTDWTTPQKQVYAKLIVEDFLLVDVTMPAATAGYFTIESSLMKGQANQSYGGRPLNDDFMDTLFGILINNGKEPVSDNVDKPYSPVLQVFPYLALPDETWAGWLKVKAARWKLGIAGNSK